MNQLVKKLIEVLDKAESRIDVEDDGRSFIEAFQFPFDYDKGYVIRCENFNIDDEFYNLDFTFNGDFFTPSDEELEYLENWIYNRINFLRPNPEHAHEKKYNF